MATPLCLLLQNVWIKDSTLHTLHSRLHPSHFTLHKLPTSIAFGFVDSISSFWNTFAVLFEELFSISPLALAPLALNAAAVVDDDDDDEDGDDADAGALVDFVVVAVDACDRQDTVTCRKTHVVKINRYMLHLHLVHFSHAGKKNLKSGFWISLCCWRMLGLK